MASAVVTPAERRATTIVVAVFLAISTVFVVDSTWVLAKGAFQLDLEDVPLDSAEARACFGEVRRLETEIDQAVAKAATVKADEAPQVYSRALADSFAPPALTKLEANCAKVPRGMVALASLLQIQRAEEAALAERGSELTPLRDDLHRALPRP